MVAEFNNKWEEDYKVKKAAVLQSMIDKITAAKRMPLRRYATTLLQCVKLGYYEGGQAVVEAALARVPSLGPHCQAVPGCACHFCVP